MTEKRDLKADLGLCNKAFLGPYKVEMIRSSDGDCLDEEGDRYYFRCGFRSQAVAELFAQAREGWPHAIERAIKAEALAREMLVALEIAYDAMYLDITNAPDYPNCERKVKEALRNAKEVLGDE